MNLGGLLKAFDTAMAIRDATRRMKGSRPAPQATPPSTPSPTAQIESRLTNVVVAALKEAFDRDHARLELERAQMDEQRRRAGEALRAELRRQALDRETGRLRLLAGTAMVGWIASILLLGWRLPLASPASRLALALGWLFLLGALGTALSSMGRLGASHDGDEAPATLPHWLLVLGLACTAVTLLL